VVGPGESGLSGHGEFDPSSGGERSGEERVEDLPDALFVHQDAIDGGGFEFQVSRVCGPEGDLGSLCDAEDMLIGIPRFDPVSGQEFLEVFVDGFTERRVVTGDDPKLPWFPGFAEDLVAVWFEGIGQFAGSMDEEIHDGAPRFAGLVAG